MVCGPVPCSPPTGSLVRTPRPDYQDTRLVPPRSPGPPVPPFGGGRRFIYTVSRVFFAVFTGGRWIWCVLLPPDIGADILADSCRTSVCFSVRFCPVVSVVIPAVVTPVTWGGKTPHWRLYINMLLRAPVTGWPPKGAKQESDPVYGLPTTLWCVGSCALHTGSGCL